jgi:hypothetical protein
MSRRVFRSAGALVFALVLTLSAPVASAATRDRSFSPNFSRIVQILKQFAHKFGITALDEDVTTAYPGPPKP